ERITGRSDDMLIIRGVNLFPSQIEELILKEPTLSGHYVLELSRPKALDELKVVAEFRPEAAANSVAVVDRVAARLQHDIKSMIGITAEVEIAPPGRVERSIGKAKRVIDRRPQR
ncbi:MAG TPA: phenylacetate--CoA ligase, partial [Stellaceae bacterium]|nr:phenylacetate--CoA ligase [Stellaceae bacterium]